jgi:hypothetical protein
MILAVPVIEERARSKEMLMVVSGRVPGAPDAADAAGETRMAIVKKTTTTAKVEFKGKWIVMRHSLGNVFASQISVTVTIFQKKKRGTPRQRIAFT